MKTMHLLQYHQHKSCIQVKHELLQIIVHCGDNWDGTLYILDFESSNKHNMEKVKKNVFCGYIRTVFTTVKFLKLKLAIKS